MPSAYLPGRLAQETLSCFFLRLGAAAGDGAQERTQLANRAIAMDMLRAKLLVVMEEQAAKKVRAKQGAPSPLASRLPPPAHRSSAALGEWRRGRPG